MPVAPTRTLIIVGAGLMLAACNTTNDRVADGRAPGTQALAMVPPPPDVTGSIGNPKKEAEPAAETNAEIAPKAPVKLPGDETESGTAGGAADAMRRGRDQYQANRFRDAERHFRQATELAPKSSEAWLGLAACYDRLRDFAKADHAYAKALAIAGPTSEVLNNQGYSYMLRGDFKAARDKLLAAQRQDPRNKFVENNLILLESSERKGR
ncbi:tetratricopeptide repeat protein [Pseudolabrys sp. Root1462]|uniref:tetratricopeptide repeat protein n=1 Tax=Pseudolabrys sp. Root1462 TaxID=1736466 RepID=UPI00138F1EBD|nr:tetratricopeptide repeat protein [Pseudolabrys sp. Root1462]